MTSAPEATTEPSQRAEATDEWPVDAAVVSALVGEVVRPPPRDALSGRSPEVAPSLLGIAVFSCAAHATNPAAGPRLAASTTGL